MARRFLQQRITLRFNHSTVLPSLQSTLKTNIHKLSQYTISSKSHQIKTTKTNPEPIDLDYSDLFSSSDDDSDLSDHSDNESDTKQNNTSQKQSRIIPKYESNRIIISNIDDKVTASDLNDLCSNYGTITDIYVPLSRNDNSTHRGFGYVSFKTTQESTNAIPNINGILLYNKILRAGYAKGTPQTKKQSNPNRKQKRTSLDLDFNENKKDISYNKKECTLKQTTINLSGLPTNVSIDQIKRMFEGIGICLNVYLYEYEQFDMKFINAVIKLDLESLSFHNTHQKELTVDLLQPIEINDESVGMREEVNVVKQNKNSKSDTTTLLRTKRRYRHKVVNQEVNENIMCAELDDLLNSES
eukprot:124899_1